MKKALLTGIPALSVLSASAVHASPRLQDLEPAGYVCEGMFGHATIFFDIKEGMAYFQINGRKTLKEHIETYWYQNKFGHTVGAPPFYLIRACWGTRQRAINAHQPAEFQGATERHFNWDNGSWKFQSGIWGWYRESNMMLSFPEFMGNCIGDYEAGANLKKKFAKVNKPADGEE
jgi:hypothetical protein